MQLKRTKMPHIRSDFRFSAIIDDVIIALIPLMILAWYFYGFRSTAICIFSSACCYALDMLSALLLRRKPMFSDLSAVVTGLIIALMMPPSIPYYVVLVADIVAILVAKTPFGGLGHNIFNPACVGFIFVLLCWSNRVFSYSLPFTKLPVFGSVENEAVADLASTLHLGGVPSLQYQEAIFGNVPGALGTCGILVLLACFLFLLVRGIVSFETPLGFIGAIALIAYIWPRGTMEGIQSIHYELLSGSIIFGAVFIINDPVTSPKRKVSKFIYGLLLGALTMIARRYCYFQVGLPFAVVIMNMLSFAIDTIVYRISYMFSHGKLGMKNNGFTNFAIGTEIEEEEKI